VERSLTSIQANIVSNWGLAVVVFSVLLKIILLPVGVMTVRFQREVSQVQALLAPQLAEIKVNYDGEEAHNRLMAAHKELGVTPFYTLKPMLGSFIQIPILIAVFNALGEMPQFGGQAFLWIENLAYPDVIGTLPLSVPLFGNTLSALPFVMTLVTLFATVIFQNRHAPAKEVKRQKRNLYLMAAVFFVLFYPFPAVMVLYWTLANLLHIVQQQFIKI
jgi:YidC/Oxa1 family membrane protein insertase